MPLKSIIDIDVQDAAFQRFQALFEKYQTQLAKTPQAWAAVGKEGKKVQSSFEAAAAALLSQAEHSKRLADAQAATAKSSRTLEHSWSSVAASTKSVASNIASATRDLIKWTGITGAFTGLLGLGGMWGLTRMAESVSMGRRSSMGRGLTYGEQQAFGINFGRIVDPGSFLGGISEARANPAMARALWGLGVNPYQGDTADIAVRALRSARGLAQQTPDSQLGLIAQSRGLGEIGIGTEEMRRLKAMSDKEFGQLQAGYSRDRLGLGLNGQTQKAWQDFTAQMQRSAQQIMNTFMKGLVPLAPQLVKLSSAFSDTVQSLLGSQGFEQLVKETAKGLKDFAAFVGTPEFKQDVQSFAAGVEEISKKIAAGLKWLGVINDPNASKSPTEKNLFSLPGGGVGILHDNRPLWDRLFHPLTRKDLNGLAHKSAFETIERKNGLPRGLLDAVYGAESGFGRNLVSPAGALGPFQLMPATAAQYGVANPFDLGQSANGAGRMFRDLLREFGGDIAKAAAAYNWGDGNVRRDIARYGADWQSHLPRETQRYVQNITGQVIGKGGVMIRIENNTGGNAVVVASQLAI